MGKVLLMGLVFVGRFHGVTDLQWRPFSSTRTNKTNKDKSLVWWTVLRGRAPKGEGLEERPSASTRLDVRNGPRRTATETRARSRLYLSGGRWCEGAGLLQVASYILICSVIYTVRNDMRLLRLSLRWAHHCLFSEYDEVSLILCSLMSNAWSCARIISILKGCNVNGYLYFIICLVVLPLL